LYLGHSTCSAGPKQAHSRGLDCRLASRHARLAQLQSRNYLNKFRASFKIAASAATRAHNVNNSYLVVTKADTNVCTLHSLYIYKCPSYFYQVLADHLSTGLVISSSALITSVANQVQENYVITGFFQVCSQ
jgi:hypothetical protein